MSAPVDLHAERELRLAVVMYGGVSLAIYMNGVAQELLNLVRATAPDPTDPLQRRARYPDGELPSRSAAVYRDVARLAAGEGSAAPGASRPGTPIRQRVVIDILSGTSAGGINAIFLAKALANAQSLDGLARLWETEADLGLLINDGDSRQNVAPAPPALPPRSLLNSRRMYLKLHEAFCKMEGAPPGAGAALVDELDLYVTTTDITGLPVRLQLGGGEAAEERRYRKAFHLRFKANLAGGAPWAHDFTADDNPFLAFIARCTSSFPFAFEPMQIAQAEERWLNEWRMQDRTRWARHFAEYDVPAPPGPGWSERPFGDGGYLDNKPFSYAIDAIADRSGSRTARVERKLVFVDPAPERALPGAPAQGGATAVPNAVENLLTALQLPAYETIREDLLRLRERNRLVDKVQSVVPGVTDDFNRLNVEQTKELVTLLNDRQGFVARDLNTVVPLFGAAYGGYHRLKVGNLTDELAALLAAQARIPLDSDESRLLRFLVRAWRDSRYTRNPAEEQAQAADPGGRGKQTEFAFLQDYDLGYRTRRLAFVVEQVSRLSSATTEEWPRALGYARAFGEDAVQVAAREGWAAVLDALQLRRRRLVEILGDLRDGRERLFGQRGERLAGTTAEHWKTIAEGIASLGRLSGDRARKARATVLLTAAGGRGLQTMQAVQEAVAHEVGTLAKRTRENCASIVPEIMQAEMPARPAGGAAGLADNIVRHYYAWYELYDSMVFPIVHGSEVGEEIAPVEPVRISPLSGRAAAGKATMDPRFLPAGVALGHFGGFLNAEWRTRDMLLGRLNAAEKLIGMLLTGVLPESAPGQEDTRDQVIHGYVRRAWEAILAEELTRQDNLNGVVTDPGSLGARARMAVDAFKAEGLAAEEPSRESSLDWLTRSVRVTAKVFDLAAGGPAAKKLTGILTRAGQALAAVTEVAVPRHWWGLLYRRWAAQLWLFGMLLALLGLLFGQDQMRLLGLKVAGVVSVFGVLALLLQGWVARSPWLRRGRLALLGLVLVLVIVGALRLWTLRQIPLEWLGRAWHWVATRLDEGSG